MEKNNGSKFSMCRKIRKALATSPAFRAIHGILTYNQESKHVTIDSSSPSSSPLRAAKPKLTTQTKPHLPQHLKENQTEGAAVIPIKFDFSNPTSNGHGNSAVSGAHGPAVKATSPPVGISVGNGQGQATKVATAVVKPKPLPHVPTQGKPPTNAGEVVRGQGKDKGNTVPLGAMESEQHHGKKDKDFNDFIQNARAKLTTMSNVGRGQSNHAPDEASGTTNNDNHPDKFSNFIHHGQKRFRLTSNVGNSSS